MHQGVFDNEADEPQLQPGPPAQTAWKPQDPVGTGLALWESVSTAWSGGDLAERSALVAQWTDALGWNQISPSSTAPTPDQAFAPLAPDMPTGLLAGFDTYYLGCPFIAAAA
jgi:hypothetical protein